MEERITVSKLCVGFIDIISKFWKHGQFVYVQEEKTLEEWTDIFTDFMEKTVKEIEEADNENF